MWASAALPLNLGTLELRRNPLRNSDLHLSDGMHDGCELICQADAGAANRSELNEQIAHYPLHLT